MCTSRPTLNSHPSIDALRRVLFILNMLHLLFSVNGVSCRRDSVYANPHIVLDRWQTITTGKVILPSLSTRTYVVAFLRWVKHLQVLITDHALLAGSLQSSCRISFWNCRRRTERSSESASTIHCNYQRIRGTTPSQVSSRPLGVS